MGESRETNLDKVCDICGVVGYEEGIRTCSQCTVGRHFYCMRVFMWDMPEDWICEECLAKNDRDSLSSGYTEDVLDSFAKVSFSLRRKITSKRQNVVKTKKVMFLPTEEVITLASRSTKKESPLRSRLRLKSLQASFTPSVSRRAFMGSKTDGPCFEQIKVRSNPTFLQLGAVHSTTTISQHAAKAPKSKEDEETAPQILAKNFHCNKEPISFVMADKEVNTVNAKTTNTMEETLSASARATSMLHPSIISTVEGALVPSKENVCEALPLDAIQPDKEQRVLHTKTDEAMRSSRSSKPSSSRSHTTIISSGQNNHDAVKPALYSRRFPAVYTAWTGGFKFPDTATPGGVYDGFLAQPPCIVHRKAYEFSQKMPPVLEVNLLHRCHLQGEFFQNGCLNLYDIALYIFPVNNTERSQKNYTKLSQLMEIENSVMVSYIDDVELLIFTSKQLDVDSQDMFTRSNTDFLCGVFHSAKGNRKKVHHKPSSVSPLEYTHDDNANMDRSEACDMDIDMVGGKFVGIPEVVVSKAPVRELNEWAAGKTLDAVTDRKICTISSDLYSVVQPISLELKQESCNYSDIPSKSTEKNKCKFTLEPVEHPIESSLVRLLGSMGEIEIPPGFEVVSKLSSIDGASKASSAEEKKALDKTRIKSQVKEEIGCRDVLQLAALEGSSPQPQGFIADASFQGSQKMQVLAYHLVNDPLAICPPPCLLTEGTKVGTIIKTEGNDDEKPFQPREKKGLQVPPFLSKDKSQEIAGPLCSPSCALKVKVELQEMVNEPFSAAHPSRLFDKGTNNGLEIKTEEHCKKETH